MNQGKRSRLSSAEKTDIWKRWRPLGRTILTQNVLGLRASFRNTKLRVIWELCPIKRRAPHRDGTPWPRKWSAR
jgi:hypothetical protein